MLIAVLGVVEVVLAYRTCSEAVYGAIIDDNVNGVVLCGGSDLDSSLAISSGFGIKLTAVEGYGLGTVSGSAALAVDKNGSVSAVEYASVEGYVLCSIGPYVVLTDACLIEGTAGEGYLVSIEEGLTCDGAVDVVLLSDIIEADVAVVAAVDANAVEGDSRACKAALTSLDDNVLGACDGEGLAAHVGNGVGACLSDVDAGACLSRLVDSLLNGLLLGAYDNVLNLFGNGDALAVCALDNLVAALNNVVDAVESAYGIAVSDPLLNCVVVEATAVNVGTSGHTHVVLEVTGAGPVVVVHSISEVTAVDVDGCTVGADNARTCGGGKVHLEVTVVDGDGGVTVTVDGV